MLQLIDQSSGTIIILVWLTKWNLNLIKQYPQLCQMGVPIAILEVYGYIGPEQPWQLL